MGTNHQRKKIQGKHRSPHKMYGVVAVAVVSVATGYMVYTGVVWWAAYLLAVNAVTFLLFGFDKAIASGHFVRVSERVLFALALAGASPALLVGQKVFHHKTVKSSFQIVFWLIVVAQIALLAYFGYDMLVPGAMQY